MLPDFVRVVNRAGQPAAEEYCDAPELVLGGQPLLRLWPLFEHLSGQAGLWSSDEYSKRKVLPDEYEFCLLLSGRVRIADVAGCSVEFGAGDAFLLEPGFDGSWTSLEPVRKFFMMMPAQTPPLWMAPV